MHLDSPTTVAGIVEMVEFAVVLAVVFAFPQLLAAVLGGLLARFVAWAGGSAAEASRRQRS